MRDQVIVFVADAKFLPHVPSIAVNCRREGEFKGDFLLIHPDDLDVSDFMRRGFVSLPVPDRGFLQKFNLFHPFLKTWKQSLFLDCDCIVQRPLSLVFDELSAAPLLVYPDGLVKPILADPEEMPAFLSWRTWDEDHEAHGLNVVRNSDTSLSAVLTEGSLYHRIASRFPHVLTERMWNTSMIAWEPLSVPDDTVERLRALQAEFGECNRPEKGGTDQQIIDLLFHQRIRLMPRKLFIYWGLDEFASRVPSDSRGWDGTEFPAVVHYARWYAPWIVKASNADAYDNNRIGDGVVCHDFYQRNLTDFDTVFSKR
jgi:hypothetical protein